MNKLYRRILFKFAQQVSNWDIFREEANKIINEKRIAAYDLYHFINQKISSSPVNIKDLLKFYSQINGFDDNTYDINFAQVKNQIELALKELMKVVNAKTEINNVLAFCREYGFLIYDLILRCMDEIILSKTNDINLFQEKFLNKYSYIQGLKTIFIIVRDNEDPSLPELKTLIGKIFKICNIKTNDTIEVSINSFSVEFVHLLGEICDNLDYSFPIYVNFGKGLDYELIKQIRKKNSEVVRSNSFISKLEDLIDYSQLSIIKINESKNDFNIVNKIINALSDYPKLDRKTMEFILSTLQGIFISLKLQKTSLPNIGEQLFVSIENACQDHNISIDYIKNNFPDVYEIVYEGGDE